MSDMRPPRVLVVEDDRPIAEVLQRSLRMEGYDVRTSGDGREALDAAHAFLPDLVVLDQVWGYDPFSLTNTIEVFISNLRKKLEANGEPRLLHTIRGAGYVLRV